MILFHRFAPVAAALGFLWASAPGALAQQGEPTPLGNFGAWTAYAYKASDTKVCYVVAEPASSKSTRKVKRDPVFFIVTHMPGRKVTGEVSTIIGYPFKEQSTVDVMVDKVAFKLFTKGDGAWAESSDMEKKIVAAMKGGKDLIVKGTSWKGTETTDRYSLNGISAAMDKINAACK
jgi:invasion protein IalB